MYPNYVIEGYLLALEPDIKRDWLAALRSGKIQQTQQRLKRKLSDGTVGMCCLGVLCDLAESEGVVASEWVEGNAMFGPDGYGSTSLLPGLVAKWAFNNVYTGSGQLPFRNRAGSVVYLDVLNDSGFTFDQIADLIECWY